MGSVRQNELFGVAPRALAELHKELETFAAFGASTRQYATSCPGTDGRPVLVPTYVNEFWTRAQRQGHRLHEVSYRACFKPLLPRFFIERLSAPGELVYDPFAGRGTVLLEAALLGRRVAACDVNPLSKVLLRPRLEVPDLETVEGRLSEIPWDRAESAGEMAADLGAFYEQETLGEILALRAWLLEREVSGAMDAADRWIRMVAVNRLTGHSAGFFSVYTLPPNQAVTPQAQRRINERRSQVPSRRDVPALILRKSRQLQSGLNQEQREGLRAAAANARLLTGPAASTPGLDAGSVALVVTSPPFLDVVQYAADNWLRCWFCGIDAEAVDITMARTVPTWQEAMTAVFRDMYRVLRPGGVVAFEVGEVRGGKIRLEDAALPCGMAAGFDPELVLIHEQDFTKTANCWGIDNNRRGTNTQRVVVFRKPG